MKMQKDGVVIDAHLSQIESLLNLGWEVVADDFPALESEPTIDEMEAEQ